MTLEGPWYRAALFKDIRKSPERHQRDIAVAFPHRIGKGRSDKGGVARFVHALYVPLGPEQRQIRHRRGLDLPAHFSDGAADTVIHGDVFVAVEEVLHRVIRISV